MAAIHRTGGVQEGGQIAHPGFHQIWAEEDSIWPLLVSEDFSKKHPKIVEGLVRADLDLHKFMKEHPDEAADIVFKALEEKIPLPVLKASLASYDYTDKIGKEQIEMIQRGIDFLKEKGFIKKGFQAAEWADPSYIDKIEGGK